MDVNKKTRLRLEKSVRPQIAAAFVAARKKLGLTQMQLASVVGTTQGTITRWEREIDTPPAQAFLVMADLVPDIDKAFWQELAGVKPAAISPRDAREIPVLHDAAAAGAGRAIDETDVDYRITFPAHVLPHGGKLYGLRVKGDSMAPRLGDGDIVIVDVASRDPKRLAGRMVAARDEDGVTIKWLRRTGDQLLLVPENLAGHNVRIMNRDRNLAIVGEVVKYISEPPQLEN